MTQGENDEEESLLEKENNTTNYKSICFIDNYMIPSKICFFLIDGISGMFWAFLVLFFVSVGLNIEEAGFIAGMRLLAATLVTPLWGYIADKTGHRKIIFTLLCFGAAFFTFPIPWLGTHFSLSVDCINSTVQSLGTRSDLCPYRPFTSPLFYILLTFVCLCSIFFNPLHGVLDSFVMNAIKGAPRQTDYAKQRIAGAFGFGTMNFLVGLALDHAAHFTKSQYTIVFIVVTVMLMLIIPAGIKVASQFQLDDRDNENQYPPQENKNKSEHTQTDNEGKNNSQIVVNQKENEASQINNQGKNNLQNVVNQKENGHTDNGGNENKPECASLFFLWTFDNVIFMSTVFVAGIANTVVNVYLFKYLDDDLHVPKTVMGLSNAFAALGEIVVFPFAQQFLRLFRGPTNVITTSVFAYALRFVVLVVVKKQWVLLLVQMLNGIGFGMFWVAATQHTVVIAPSSLYITTFTIVSNVYFNIGGMAGNWVGGIIYELYTGEGLFLLTSALCSLFIVIRVVYYNLIKRYICR